MLTNIKTNVKELIAANKTEKAILYLREQLVLHSETYDRTILLSAKLNRISDYKHTNIISYQDFEVEVSKIENAMMYLVNNLETTDVKQK